MGQISTEINTHGHQPSDVATAMGAYVRRFAVGDAVYARPNRLRIGAFAERIAVYQDEVAHKHQSLGFEEAAKHALVLSLGATRPSTRRRKTSSKC